MDNLSISKFTRHVRLDRHAPELPVALARAVERAVEQRLLQEGAALPSAADLAEAYDVSLATIRSGFAALVDRGVLTSRRGPGGGYWIAQREASLQRLTDEYAERAKAGGFAEIEIARSVQHRLPRLLSLTERFQDRAAARQLFGTIHSELNDLAENHDRYLDENT